MQVWSINYTLPFKHGQICKHCFYWIVCNTGIYRKVNFEGFLLFYLFYKLHNIFLIHNILPTNQYFLAFFVWSVICSILIKIVLDISRYVVSSYSTGYLVLPYIEKLISTIVSLATFCCLIWAESRTISGI